MAGHCSGDDGGLLGTPSLHVVLAPACALGIWPKKGIDGRHFAGEHLPSGTKIPVLLRKREYAIYNSLQNILFSIKNVNLEISEAISHQELTPQVSNQKCSICLCL